MKSFKTIFVIFAILITPIFAAQPPDFDTEKMNQLLLKISQEEGFEAMGAFAETLAQLKQAEHHDLAQEFMDEARKVLAQKVGEQPLQIASGKVDQTTVYPFEDEEDQELIKAFENSTLNTNVENRGNQ